MGAAINIHPTPTLGPWVRNLRLYLKLTQKEIARLAKVTIEDIALLEDSKPISPDTMRRIFKELHKKRVLAWNTLTNC